MTADLSYRLLGGREVLADGELLRWLVISWVRAAESRRRGTLDRPRYEELQTRLIIALLPRCSVAVASAGEGLYAGFAAGEANAAHYVYVKRVMRRMRVGTTLLEMLPTQTRIATHAPDAPAVQRYAASRGWVYPLDGDPHHAHS